MEIGMRRGKRRAIHVLGEVHDASKEKVEVKKLYSDEWLCSIHGEHEIKEGLTWVSIVPTEGVARGAVRLMELKRGRKELLALFEREKGGKSKKVEIKLDDRGRAKKLRVGEEYFVDLLSRKAFFERYERMSIAVGKGKRSEPNRIGEARIENFREMIDVQKGTSFDVATGIKEYLRILSKEGFTALGNISPSILSRTRDWLKSGSVGCIVYDAEAGFPFRDGSLDLVVCDAFLEYVLKPLKVLQELSRKLKRGGRLLLLEPLKPLSNVEEFYPQDLWEVALWRPLHDPSFNAEIVEGVLENIGFKVEDRRKMEFEYPIYRNERFRQDVVNFSFPSQKTL
ncbi:MAG: methyltransferase domain-containing protein [Candidatus Hydrothermarchaeales archaeon]